MPRFAMASGKMIDLANFTENDVDIYDIAHHLAKIQRFNGATPINKIYSVGEHCINLARYFDHKDMFEKARIALLHDASEAYLSDIVSPAKRLIPDYVELENSVQKVIYQKLMKYVPTESMYKQEDKNILLDEVKEIMPEKLGLYETDAKQALNCEIQYNNHSSTVARCYITFAKELNII